MCSSSSGSTLSYFGNFRVWHLGIRLHSTDLLVLGDTFVHYYTIFTAMRSTALALASAALLSSTSLGFKQTSPLLVWSSEP